MSYRPKRGYDADFAERDAQFEVQTAGFAGRLGKKGSGVRASRGQLVENGGIFGSARPLLSSCPAGASSSANRENVSANHLDNRWDKVVRDFRHLCVLRRQERRGDADALLNQSLPQSIAEWSKHDSDSAGAKKARLDSMFQQEQRRIEDAWLLKDLISDKLTNEFLPVLCSSVCVTVGEELRKAGAGRDSDPAAAFRETRSSAEPAPRSRVAFDDIPSVIDLLLDHGFQDTPRRQMVPN